MAKFILLLFGLVAGLIVLVLLVVYVYQEKLIFYPEKLSRGHKFTFNYPVTEVFLPSAGDAELHALHFKTTSPKGTVLYFHGNAGSLRSWGFVAEDFLVRGYNVFMPDYRGYGKSTGRVSEKSLLQDAELAFQFVQNNSEGNIIVYGRSLGTGIATHLAANTRPKALILETPFTSFTDLAQVHFPYLPAALLLRYSFRADKWIKKVSCRVFMVHGTQDEVIPFRLGQRLAKEAGPNTQFTAIKGGRHNNLSQYPQFSEMLNLALGPQTGSK